MKKRILSVLLLLAMLVTMVPVVATAEEVNTNASTTPSTNTSTETPDLHELYVKDGLVALFTAFSDDGSVDLENGTWANKVEGGDAAILRDDSAAGSYWQKLDMGIGYAMTFAQYKTSADYRKVGISLSEDYNTDNFTVEAFAMVVGMTDENGDRFISDKEGNLFASNSSAFRFDIVGSLFFAGLRGGYYSASADKTYDYYKTPNQPNTWSYGTSSSLAIRWFAQNVGFTGGNPVSPAKYFETLGNGQESAWLYMSGSPSAADTDHTIPTAGVLQFVKTTTAGADRASTSIKYSVSYNNEGTALNYNGTVTENTTTVTGEEYDEIVAANERTTANEYSGAFSLFNGMPGEVYAIRVYNDELTAAEKAQNRLVDMMFYHGAEVSKLLFEDETALQLAAGIANDMVISSDPAKKEANKIMLEATVKSIEVRREILSSYAATEDLVAFFTAYDRTTVDLSAGTWTDIVSGAKATFESASNWQIRDNGAVGFDAWASFIAADGTYTVPENAKNLNGWTGSTAAYAMNKYRLLFDVDLLPDEDFTVEYLATYRPLLIADAANSTSTTTAYYKEDGVLVSAYDYAVANGLGTGATAYLPEGTSGAANDMFGFFGSFTRVIDGPAGWGSTPRGSMFWFVGLAYFGNPTNQQFLGGGWGVNTANGDSNGLAKTGDAYHVVGGTSFNTYGVTVDEEKVGDDTTAKFSLFRDGALYATPSKINSTANNAAADIIPEGYYYFKGSDGNLYYKSGSTYYLTGTTTAKADDVTVGSQQAEEWGTAYYDCDFTELMGLYNQGRHGFWLSAGTPTDFLSVRVYNRVLTQAEQELNRLVDILTYYGISVSSDLLKDEGFVSELVYTLGNFAEADIVTDAAQKEAIAANIKAVVDTLVSSVERDRKNDYASLYVKEGENAKLVGLFTTFDGNYSVDFANGAWKNQVEGGENATLRNGAVLKYWQRRDMGIGYTMDYKTSIYRTSVGAVAGENDYKSPNTDYRTVGLSLPDSYATLDEYTLEAFAKVVGPTDENGERFVAQGQKYNNHISAFNLGIVRSVFFQNLVYTAADASGNTTGYPIYYYYRPEGNANYPYGTNNSWYISSSLGLRWFVQNCAFYTNPAKDFQFNNNDDKGWLRMGDGEGDHKIPVAGVMQVTKDMTLGDSDETTSITYSISYNNATTPIAAGAASSAAKVNSYTLTKAKETEILNAAKSASATDYDQYNGDFAIFNNMPADVYAVRVYDGVLTEAEKAQNRLADLMYYHGVDIDESLSDPEILAMAASMANSITISADASKTAANKAVIEAAIESASIKIEMLNAYAGRDSLTAFFTTEDPATINTESGLWTDIVSGAAATLEGAAWSIRDDGTVGFDAWAGYMSNGVYKAGKSGFTGSTTAYFGNWNGLNIGIEDLPDGDFTVEYSALYRPLLIADLDKTLEAGKLVYYTENGVPVSAYENGGNAAIPQSAAGRGGDALGWFSNHTQNIDGTSEWGSTLRGAVHWTFDLNSFGSRGSNYRFLTGGWATGLSVAKNPWHKTDANTYNTYGIYVDESVTADGETEALFGLYRDGVFYADNSAKINSTANNAAADVINDGTDSAYYAGSDGNFYYMNWESVEGVSTQVYYQYIYDAATDTYSKTDANGEKVKKADSVSVASAKYEDWGTSYYASDYAYDNNAGFWLSAGVPTDFYAVRVYNRTLTDGEKLHNRLIDLVYYYNVELPKDVLDSEDMMQSLAVAASSIALSTNPLEIAAAKLMLEDAIVQVLAEARNYSLYVKDGLVAHFSALSAGDLSASVSNGVWFNRVANAGNATFGNTTMWTRNANGSVGYSLFHGTMDDNGNYVSSSVYDNVAVTGTRLDLGRSLLPDDNFTLEYVAQHNPIYVADKLGDPYVEEDGTLAETYNYHTVDGISNTPGLSSISTAVFSIGYLRGFTTNRDGLHDKAGLRGDLAWTISGSYDWYRSFASQLRSANGAPIKDVFGINGSVHTYAISRVEDTAQDHYKGTYTFARDNDTHTIYNIDGSVKEDANVNGYVRADFTIPDAVLEKDTNADKTSFYLSDRIPTDFYAVRVYDRTLSVREMAQNHFADIVIYYGLTFEDALLEDADLLAACAAALKDARIVTDALEKVANREAYQALIDATVASETHVSTTDYDSLYVKDGLVGLFTAFEGDSSVDVFAGTWKNKAVFEEGATTYGDATLRTGFQYWKRSAIGVGYTMNESEWNTDGKNVGISLDDKYEDLENFTVETFATLVGITDEDGNRIANKTHYKTGRSGFRFGMLTSLTFASLSPSAGESLLNRWHIANFAFKGGDYTASEGYAIKDDTPSPSDAGWKTRGDGITPLPGLMQVTKEVAKTEDVATNVTYKIAYDCNETPVQQATLTWSAFTAYEQYDTSASTYANYVEGDGYRFTLFNTVPSTVYAIRVYDRVLTADEKLQNSFVDKAAWYGLDVSGFASLDDGVKESIINVFTTVDYSRDADAIQAIYDFYKLGGRTELADSTVSFKEIQPILAGANGYRVFFELNKTAYDMFVASGYTVTYGALVAPGGSVKAVNDVTVGADGVHDIVVGGEHGSYIFKELAGAGGYLYTAAITADNAAYFGADMIVRGYIKVEKDGADPVIYYDTASLNGDEQISIVEAADYFVNRYNGDIKTQYTYMNSAALRAILASCGYEARTTLVNDLVIYVDAVNGSDETGNGLTADTAYATIEKAYEAAKAHLGKSGYKTVTVQLAAGTYYVSEELKLTGDDILADAYRFEVIGAGDTTVLTSEKEIVYGEVLWDELEEMTYIQVPQNEDGTYPHFRALYGDGELLELAHKGTGEATWDIADFYIIDASGNKLSPVQGYDSNGDGEIDENDTIGTDWYLSKEDKLIAEYAVFKLPAEMFDTDFIDLYGGTELHISVLWESNIAHIDYAKVDPSDSSYVLAYVKYGEMPHIYTNAKFKNQICWLENSLQFTYGTNGYYYNEENGRLYWDSSEEDGTGFYSVDKLTYASLASMFVFDGVENVAVRNLSVTGLDTKYITPDATADLGQSGSLTLREHELIVTNQKAVDEKGADPVYAWKSTSIGYLNEGAVAGKNVSGLTVEGISVYDTLSGGVVIRGVVENVVVDSSRFENLGASAIQLSETLTNYVKGASITNNYVNTIGTVYKAVAGILLGDAANVRVIGNTVVNTPWSSFSFGNSFTSVESTIDQVIGGGDFGLFNLEVAYNYAIDFMTSQHDGGAFYMNGRAVVPDNDPDSRYNFLHHNYVVMDNESGLTGSGTNNTADGGRVVYCYYFETGSSNWYAYNNVLLNEVNKTYENATFYGVFFQAYAPNNSQARNITLEDNYYVGFDSIGQVLMNHWANPQAKFDQSMSDYVYASVADLAADNAVVGTHNTQAVSKESLAGAGATVAGLFASAGSSLSTEGKVAYLTYTKENATEETDLTAGVAAPDRVIGTDAELVDASIFADSLVLTTVTFDDGNGTVASVKGLYGAPVSVPAAFAQEGRSYVFSVGGEEIDISTYTVPAEDVTVNVAVLAETYDVVIRGGAVESTVKVAVGDLITLPDEVLVPGMKVTATYDGCVVDLDTFKMPAENIELRVSYTAQKYLVSFDDGEGKTAYFSGEYGDLVKVGADIFVKDYMHPVYKVDGVEIDIATYTVPAEDVLVTVEYEYNTYKVYFKSDLSFGNDTTILEHGFVEVTFGELITLPETLANMDDYTAVEGWVATFNGTWKEFTLGTTTLNADNLGDAADLTIWGEWTWSEAGSTEPEYALGDINGDGLINNDDIVLLKQVYKNTVADPTQVKGVTDLDDNGVINNDDIVLLKQIYKNASAS